MSYVRFRYDNVPLHEKMKTYGLTVAEAEVAAETEVSLA